MAETNNTKVKKQNKLAKFFREAKAELKKVTWPSKDQLIHNTCVIIAFIAIVCIILALLDLGFGELMGLLVPKA